MSIATGNHNRVLPWNCWRRGGPRPTRRISFRTPTTTFGWPPRTAAGARREPARLRSCRTYSSSVNSRVPTPDAPDQGHICTMCVVLRWHYQHEHDSTALWSSISPILYLNIFKTVLLGYCDNGFCDKHHILTVLTV